MTTWRLLTESGDYLITEAGEQLINETIASDLSAASSISADLKVVQGFSAELFCQSSITAAVTTSITIASSLTAESSIASGLTTNIRAAANLTADSSVTAGITTNIPVFADLEASSSVSAGITTNITLASNLSASSSITAEVIFYRPLFASLDSSASIAADIKTVIALHAGLDAASSITATLTTSINAMAALVSVSNIVDANLKVTRLPVRVDNRNKYIFLAEIQGYDPATSAVVTWRFSSGKGYDNAGTYYKPRIENPARFSRSLSVTGVGGKQSTSYGELTLVNLDNELNELANDFFDGRTLTIKRGKQTDSYASFSTILIATVDSVAMERERVSVRLRDRTYLLDKPFDTTKYDGSNTLPNGFEGTADDLKGQSKPRIFGRIALFTPVLVNTSKLVYQVNNGAVDAVINVFDSGAYLSRGTDYANTTEMMATAPIAGEWRAYPAGGYFRLGTSAFGQVSACVAEKWAYLDCSAAGIIQRVLTAAGYSSSDWIAADFTALNQKNAGSIGVVIGADETTSSIIDRVCQSAGIWWGVDSLNRFRFARLDAPAGAPVATITDNEIIDIERQPESKPAVWQSTLKSDINYIVMDRNSLAGVVTDDRANWFSRDSRDQSSENASVKTQRLLAEAESYDSSLNGISIAKAEADRRLALFSARRDVITVTVGDPASQYENIDLGDVVNVQTDQLGYTAGRNMVVTSLEPDYKSNTFDMTLWG